eukprot:Nk52_evm1s2455 gene=Nk52_evmTU1s2455
MDFMTNSEDFNILEKDDDNIFTHDMGTDLFVPGEEGELRDSLNLLNNNKPGRKTRKNSREEQENILNEHRKDDKSSKELHASKRRTSNASVGSSKSRRGSKKKNSISSITGNLRSSRRNSRETNTNSNNNSNDNNNNPASHINTSTHPHQLQQHTGSNMLNLNGAILLGQHQPSMTVPHPATSIATRTSGSGPTVTSPRKNNATSGDGVKKAKPKRKRDASVYVSDAIMKRIEQIKKTQKDEHNDTLTNKQVVEYTFYENVELKQRVQDLEEQILSAGLPLVPSRSAAGQVAAGMPFMVGGPGGPGGGYSGPDQMNSFAQNSSPNMPPHRSPQMGFSAYPPNMYGHHDQMAPTTYFVPTH